MTVDTGAGQTVTRRASPLARIDHRYLAPALITCVLIAGQITFGFLQSCTAKVSHLLPFLRDLRILRQWTGICDVSADFSPIMGATGVDGLLVTTGWGTWGFKAIPAGGEQMAELIATGRTPPLLEPFGLNRFALDHAMADQGSTGTR